MKDAENSGRLPRLMYLLAFALEKDNVKNLGEAVYDNLELEILSEQDVEEKLKTLRKE